MSINQVLNLEVNNITKSSLALMYVTYHLKGHFVILK